MRRKEIYFYLVIVCLLLSGCASKESTKFKNDKQIQEEIKEAIILEGKEFYNLDLVPNMKKIKFGLQDGVPLINDEELIVPVETTNKPDFSFDVVITVDVESNGTRNLGEIDVDGGSSTGLGYLGDYLLIYIFEERYKSAFEDIHQFEKLVSLNYVDVSSKTSVHIEDVEEEKKIKQALSSDYNKGQFNNPEAYDDLLDKYMLEEDYTKKGIYYPDVYFNVKRSYDTDVDMDKKYEAIIEYILQSDDLPLAGYHLSTDLTKDEEGLYEFFYKED